MMIETVQELFDHFNIIPEKIVYFDIDNNVLDCEYFDGTLDENQGKLDVFLDTYGERELIDFFVDGVEKGVHIDFCERSEAE